MNALVDKVHPATFIVFDIIELNGVDLSNLPLRERLRILSDYPAGDRIKKAQQYPIEDLAFIAERARKNNEEGLMLKRLDRPYKPSPPKKAERPDHWVKLKFWITRTFPIVRWERTEKGGFNLIISNRGREQEVVLNDLGKQQEVLKGTAKFVVVRFLDEGPDGALRQPHVRGVMAHEPKEWGNDA